MKVLIADDDSAVMRVLRFYAVKQLGHDVVSVASGEGAQSVLDTDHTIELIVSDHHMQPDGMKGSELLEWVRAQPGLEKTPFILWTGGTADTDLAERCAAQAAIFGGKAQSSGEMGKLIARAIALVG